MRLYYYIRNKIISVFGLRKSQKNRGRMPAYPPIRDKY